MLRELHISNLAVIEDVAVELGEGLNCFTGQTGAGKSLVLGAFEILLGMKAAGAEAIRPGADEARISGMFELHDPAVAQQIGTLIDSAIAPGDQLLITRKFFSSGRSSLSVNGQPATAGMVRSIGELLVDIHGQHDHQYLLKPSNQLHILDGFAKSADQRHAFSELAGETRRLTQRRTQLIAGATLRRGQVELFEFQAGEIDGADPRPGEFDEHRRRHAFLTNVEKLKREAGQVHSALHEAEGAVLERLQMISHVLSTLAETDDNLGPTADQVKTATLSLQDAAFELGRYVSRLEVDDRSLKETDDRLNTLNRLISKYGQSKTGIVGNSVNVDPLESVIAYRAQIGKELDSLRGQDEDMESIDGRLAELKKEMQQVGTELTAKRKTAAAKLRPLIEQQLAQLGMGEAQFEVEFVPVAPDNSPDQPVASSGLETIEMMVRTNPGQPARPLRKIASGGELSRIMLAVKSILAQSDRVSVLVFDEIDANIGGRMGTVIGEKLRQLARGGALVEASAKPGKGGKKKPAAPTATSGHQVVCITHLPQIAAYADRHLRIAKAVTGKGAAKQTRTTVTRLDGDERISELAEMLAGKDASDTTRQQVRELLETAGSV